MTVYPKCMITLKKYQKIADLLDLFESTWPLFSQIMPSNRNSRNQACTGSFTSISTQLSVALVFGMMKGWVNKQINYYFFFRFKTPSIHLLSQLLLNIIIQRIIIHWCNCIYLIHFTLHNKMFEGCCIFGSKLDIFVTVLTTLTKPKGV